MNRLETRLPSARERRGNVARAGVLVACGVLFALRRPDALLHPQLWAEDATIFHLGAAYDGAISLISPHVGYFHTWPRLLAWFAQAFDPAWAPAIYAYGAWFGSVAIVASILWARWPGDAVTGVMAALGLTLAPHYSQEIFLTPTNLQWLLAPWLVSLLLIEPPVRRREIFALAVAAGLGGLTSPFVIVLAPLAAWQWKWNADQRGRPIYAGLLLAAALQASAVLSSSSTAPGGSWATPWHYLQVIGLRLGIETFVPQKLWPSSGGTQLAAGGVLLLFIAVLAARPGEGRRQRVMLTFAFLGFLATALFRTRATAADLLDPGWGDRYFFTLRVLLLWLIWLGTLGAPRPLRWFASVALVFVPFASAARYQAPARVDLRWRDYVPALRAGRAVEIPIHPVGWTYSYPGRKPALAGPRR